MSQSTNDAYPTALKVAILRSNDELVAVLTELAQLTRLDRSVYKRKASKRNR